MKTPQQVIGEIIVAALAVAVALAILWFVGHKVLDFIQAGPNAELEASRGNEAAAKAGIEHQNAGVDALKDEGDKRKAASREAVKVAGQPEFKKAQAIQSAPARGSTPLERAINRLNEDLGL